MTNEQLVFRIRNNENAAANMAQLYEQNRGIIATYAKKYQNHAEFDDLMQEGYIGLSNAVDAWEPERGAFITCAGFWIKQGMLRYIENCGSSIRVPVHARARIRKYLQIRQQYQQTIGRDPEEWELCRLLGVSRKVLEQIKEDLNCMDPKSLDKRIGEGEDTTLQELVSDQKDHYEQTLEKVQQEQLKAVIWPMVDNLEGQQSRVIRMRFQDNLTLKETGEVLGVSLERVRVVQAKGLRKLSHPKYTDILRTFLEDGEIRSKGMQGTGVHSFRRTWTSATERVALRRLDEEEEMILD